MPHGGERSRFASRRTIRSPKVSAPPHADPAGADEIAAALMSAAGSARAALWARADVLPAVELAWALKRACDTAWRTDPSRTQVAAELLETLAAARPAAEIDALATWVRGIGLLAQGQMEPALAQLQFAGERFIALGRPYDAAQTSVARLAALAMLGRYDEALRCGDEARAVFDAAGDASAAGKIEFNLGTLATRRDRYDDALRHYSAALQRLASAGDVEREVAAMKGMADVRSRRHEFEAADALYRQAHARAEHAGLMPLAAMIDTELGMHEMRRGRFDHALRQLEHARRACADLGQPHYLALTEEKLADTYLELNLLPEALALYERSLATYEAAGLATDRAWALSQHGRALTLLGRHEAATQALAQAEAAFVEEGNPVGAALVHTWQAELALARRDWPLAARHASAAQPALQTAQHTSGWLHACALHAEALRGAGEHEPALRIARTAIATAEALRIAPAQRRLRMLLGLLARDRGDDGEARRAFEAVVDSIESQRGMLPGEEFRAAFLGHNLLPYHELVRASLAAGGPPAAQQALRWLERGRARALADSLDASKNDVEAIDATQRELGQMQRRLDDCYRALSRAPGQDDERDPGALLAEVQRIEAALLEADRRSVQGGAARAGTGAAFDLDTLHRALGEHSALVEYFSIDDELHACIVVGGTVEAVPLSISLPQTRALIEPLRFQIDTLRHGARLTHRSADLQARVLHHLRPLHECLWAPFAARLDERRAVVVPHGVLHHLPFAALHDGARHEIERRELCQAPSAAVLLRCLQRSDARFERALVLGHADERLPQVGAEVHAVAARFAQARTLHGEHASAAALRAGVASAVDVVHIACHAQFRHDSPRFSALHLADGAFTVLDAARLRLSGGLVTLSACDTGVSAVMPGDELVGLTHGFISAGATRVLASLWAVQDDTTAPFMRGFYDRLLAGSPPADALRATQIEALRTHPHPYFWAGFVLHGGW